MFLLSQQITILFNVIFYKAPSYGDSYSYPAWAEALGWLIALFPMSLIVIVFLYRFCRSGGYGVRTSSICDGFYCRVFGSTAEKNHDFTYRPCFTIRSDTSCVHCLCS